MCKQSDRLTMLIQPTQKAVRLINDVMFRSHYGMGMEWGQEWNGVKSTFDPCCGMEWGQVYV